MLRFNDEQRRFYARVVSLVGPMALQNLINVGVTSADVIMLGKVGEKALSGVSLGSQIQYIMTLVFFGLTSGVSVLTAQYWGKRDVDTIEQVLGLALKIALGVGLFFLAAAQAFPQALMSIYSGDPEVIREGVGYLKVVSFTYPMIALTMVYLNTMRSVEQVRIATVVYFCSLLINICFNAIFIFGLLGLPAMGAVGAAYATLIARATELAMIIFYDRRLNPVFHFRLSSLRTRSRLLIRDFFRYALPIICNELIWGAGSSMTAAVLGHLGSSVTAANSVAQVARSLAQVVNFGIANAAAIVLGKAIGAHQEEKARIYSGRFIRLCLIFGALGSAVVLAVIPAARLGLDLSPQSQELLTMMLCVLAVVVVTQSYNTTVICGILRSGGDAKFGLCADGISLWCGAILFGWLAAFVFHWPTPVVYMILMCDEIIKIPVVRWRYGTYIWLKNITRDQP